MHVGYVFDSGLFQLGHMVDRIFTFLLLMRHFFPVFTLSHFYNCIDSLPIFNEVSTQVSSGENRQRDYKIVVSSNVSDMRVLIYHNSVGFIVVSNMCTADHSTTIVLHLETEGSRWTWGYE